MISFVGLGNMGALIAAGIADSHDVRAYDLSPMARAAFSGPRRSTADRVDLAVNGTDVAVLCLPGASIVEDVLFGPNGVTTAERPPHLVIDCTSSEPFATRMFAERLAEHGIAFVDAPVSGGLLAARTRSLTAMVGGNKADIESAGPILDTFAAHWGVAGPIGAGHATKAINNFLSSASYLLTSEALVAGRALGVDADELVSAFGAGVTRTQNSEIKFPKFVLTRTFEAGFSVGLEIKDVDIAFGIGLASSVPLPMLVTSRGLWTIGMRQLGADADFTRIYELVETWTTAGGAERPVGTVDEEIVTALRHGLAAAVLAATLEAAVLVESLDLDPAAVFDLVAHSSGRNVFAEALAAGTPADPERLAAAAGWSPPPAEHNRRSMRALARASRTSMTLTLTGLESRHS
jgi:3-hydroxyisobutyrate dehydrogenase